MDTFQKLSKDGCTILVREYDNERKGTTISLHSLRAPQLRVPSKSGSLEYSPVEVRPHPYPSSKPTPMIMLLVELTGTRPKGSLHCFFVFVFTVAKIQDKELYSDPRSKIIVFRVHTAKIDLQLLLVYRILEAINKSA